MLAGSVAALDRLGVPLADQFQATVTSLPFGPLVFDWLPGALLFEQRLSVIAVTLLTTLITLLTLGAAFTLCSNGRECPFRRRRRCCSGASSPQPVRWRRCLC